MNRRDAQDILLACRPGTPDLQSEEARAALDEVRRDPELAAWWARQQAFHEQARHTLRHLPVPDGLPDRILSHCKTVELPWWRTTTFLSAAAAIVVLAITIALFWKTAPRDPLPTFRSRMVRNVLRQYAMDIQTNDVTTIRTFLAERSAPADYQVPPPLSARPLIGAGVLSWQERKVSMVCIDSQTQGTLFLFVANDPLLKRPPGQTDYSAVSDLMTVSWSEGDKTYLLAGYGDRAWLEKQLR
jgi:hypothetical protein